MANLCVKWETQSSAYLESISKIHLQERFSDATIICRGRYFSVHRIVLSSCSVYFEEIFEKIKSQHPVVVFTDIEPFKMELLLNFMYQGEAEVEQENFMSFMKTGEALKIKGISVNDVYTYKNSFLNKKRKRSSNESVRSKRKIRDNPEVFSLPITNDIPETSSLQIDSGTQDEGNDNVCYSGSIDSACDYICENKSDVKDFIKEEPYFDDRKSGLLTESFTKSSGSNEVFDNHDDPLHSRTHDELKVAKYNENYYHADDVSIEMENINAEGHPSVSAEYCSVNNAQEPHLVKKKKISAPKGKNSKVSLKNALDVIENMGNDLHNHTPTEGKARRRCCSCARIGKEKRTKLYCSDCHLPFCKECFTPWHLQLQIGQTFCE